MATATISKRITKGEELIIIPRREYEEFLELKRAIPVVSLTLSDKRALKKAREEYKQGKCLSWDKVKNELVNRNHKKC